MAKREISSEVWSDPWFMALPPDIKLFWLYLNTNCDYAGGWKPNIPLAEFKIGIKIIPDAFKVRINNGQKRLITTKHLWFMPIFVHDQYGDDFYQSEGKFQKKVTALHNQYLEMVSTGCGQGVDSVEDKEEESTKREEGKE